MAPPQLARDAPRLNVVHPFVVGLLPVLGMEARAAVLHRLDRLAGQRFGVHIPLLGQPRLDHHARPVALGHGVAMGLDAVQVALLLQVGDHPLAGLVAVQALIAVRRVLVDVRVLVEDVDLGQVVALADLEVVEVVRRRDLDGTRALFGVGPVVGDDGQAPVDQRQDHVLADHVLVAVVVRVHGDGGVAQHGLRPGGGDHDVAVGVVLQRIADVPVVAVHLLLHHLQVGNGGQQLGVPVDQPGVLVDQTLPIEVDEHLEHGGGQPVVHGEAFA